MGLVLSTCPCAWGPAQQPTHKRAAPHAVPTVVGLTAATDGLSGIRAPGASDCRPQVPTEGGAALVLPGVFTWALTGSKPVCLP